MSAQIAERLAMKIVKQLTKKKTAPIPARLTRPSFSQQLEGEGEFKVWNPDQLAIETGQRLQGIAERQLRIIEENLYEKNRLIAQYLGEQTYELGRRGLKRLSQASRRAERKRERDRGKPMGSTKPRDQTKPRPMLPAPPTLPAIPPPSNVPQLPSPAKPKLPWPPFLPITWPPATEPDLPEPEPKGREKPTSSCEETAKILRKLGIEPPPCKKLGGSRGVDILAWLE